MAIKTVSSQRTRTELAAFTDTVLADVLTAFAAYETAQAADDTKTWTVTPISFFFDGTNYILIAYASYPEINEDPTGQVPELP